MLPHLLWAMRDVHVSHDLQRWHLLIACGQNVLRNCEISSTAKLHLPVVVVERSAAAFGLTSMALRYCLVYEVLSKQLLVLRADHFDLTVARLVLLVATLFHKDFRVAFMCNVLHSFKVATDDKAHLSLGYANAVDEAASSLSDKGITLAD